MKIKTKFWIYSLVIMGIVTMLHSSCTKDDDVIPTYEVTYDGNNNTGGNVPIDENSYEVDAMVTVLGNTGSLVKTGYSYAGWNTESDGSGIDYASDSTFTISNVNVTLYAKWITGGKLTVKISNANNFNNHSIYYSIYDTNTTDPITGAPNGNILGQAQLNIINNAGSVVTVTSISDLTEKVFDNNTYYLGGMVDMNDNAASMGYAPDTGDKYGDFITVVINGDSDLTLTEENFPYLIP